MSREYVRCIEPGHRRAPLPPRTSVHLPQGDRAMPILAPPFPIPAYLVGGLTLLSTLIAGVRKAALLHAAGKAGAGQALRFFNYPWLAPVSLLSQFGFTAGTLYYDFAPPAPGSAAYVALAIGM